MGLWEQTQDEAPMQFMRLFTRDQLWFHNIRKNDFLGHRASLVSTHETSRDRAGLTLICGLQQRRWSCVAHRHQWSVHAPAIRNGSSAGLGWAELGWAGVLASSVHSNFSLEVNPPQILTVK